MKYKVGDKVRIVSEKPSNNWNTDMDMYLWKVVTISSVLKWFYRKEDGYYRIKEDPNLWAWSENMIEWLVEEEWTPKEGEVIEIMEERGDWMGEERTFICKDKNWFALCTWEENNYKDGEHYWARTFKHFRKLKDKKKERKLMMTDSEWEKFQKNNNL